MQIRTTAAEPSAHLLIPITFASVALIAAALAFDPVFAASDGVGGPGIAPDFATLDIDADGTLSEREWRKSASASAMSDDIAAAHYAMYDIDANGRVTRDEYMQVNAEVLGGREDEAI